MDPILAGLIRTKASEVKNKSILGLTILYKELFVLSEESSETEVYDSVTFAFRRRLIFKELVGPQDIASSKRNNCLYILDYKGSDRSMEILRVDRTGKLKQHWSTGDDYGRGLSVTHESNVIFTVFIKHKINEYSSNGQLIREINLSSEAGIRYPNYAIKLTNGNFVVSYGDAVRNCA